MADRTAVMSPDTPRRPARSLKRHTYSEPQACVDCLGFFFVTMIRLPDKQIKWGAWSFGHTRR